MQYPYRRNALLIVIVLTFSACGPFGPFDPNAFPPPSYDSSENWLCRPDTEDVCDDTPSNAGLIDGQATAEADCFAVHPTTYLIGSAWNTYAEDEGAIFPSSRFARGQFSAFNGTCRIYAPRYRQVHGNAFANADDESLAEAWALAYKDVEDAFDYYLEHENGGRPFFLAGHSQGAWLLEELVREKIEGTSLADDLVAAYLIGGVLRPNSFTEIPYCDGPQETGCVIGWNTVVEDYTSQGAEFLAIESLRRLVPGDPHCTNPLSWTVDGVGVPKEQNPGSVSFAFTGVIPELVGASCRGDGALGVNPPLTPVLELEYNMPGYLGLGDYHAADYGLFYMSIRENAQNRLDSYLQ